MYNYNLKIDGLFSLLDMLTSVLHVLLKLFLQLSQVGANMSWVAVLKQQNGVHQERLKTLQWLIILRSRKCAHADQNEAIIRLYNPKFCIDSDSFKTINPRGHHSQIHGLTNIAIGSPSSQYWLMAPYGSQSSTTILFWGSLPLKLYK